MKWLRDTNHQVASATWQLPVNVAKADPNALRVNGWYDRAVQAKHDPGSDSFRTLVTQPHEFAREFTLLTHGCALVGAVPSFDERHLDALIRKNGACPSWHYQPVDVETLAVGWLLGAAWVLAGEDQGLTTQEERDLMAAADEFQHPPWDSTRLCEVLGITVPTDTKHTAMGDVRWAWDVYQKVTTRG